MEEKNSIKITLAATGSQIFSSTPVKEKKADCKEGGCKEGGNEEICGEEVDAKKPAKPAVKKPAKPVTKRASGAAKTK